MSSDSLTQVVRVATTLRLHAVTSEYQVQDALAAALTAAGISFEREVRLSPRNRVDFLCEGGVAIEVKRGKPNTRRVQAQVDRYCACEQVTALVIVTERALIWTPSSSSGKIVQTVALSLNWGLATG
jgi:hypothetical protein